MKFNLTVTVIVVIYLLIMLFIGWYSSKKITSNTDFMVAGRRLGPFLMAGTLAATEIGGGSSLGVVQNGMSGYGISAAWYIITMGLAFVVLTFLAPKFRAATVKTVPEYFRRRYGKSAGIVTAIIMLLPLVGLIDILVKARCSWIYPVTLAVTGLMYILPVRIPKLHTRGMIVCGIGGAVMFALMVAFGAVLQAA